MKKTYIRNQYGEIVGIRKSYEIESQDELYFTNKKL